MALKHATGPVGERVTGLEFFGVLKSCELHSANVARQTDRLKTNYRIDCTVFTGAVAVKIKLQFCSDLIDSCTREALPEAPMPP